MKTCSACSTENDDTRVFCSNCAKRLPPAISASKPGLPASASDSVGTSAPQIFSHQTKKPAAKLRQAGASFSTILFRFLFLIALGALGLGIYLAIQPPSSSLPNPTPAASSEEIAQTLTFLRTASKSSGGAWQIDESGINRFLAATVQLRTRDNPLGVKIQFKRCYTALNDGRLDFIMQVSVYDRPMDFRVGLAPDSQNGKLSVRVVNAAIGQLPIPGPVAQFLLPLWSPCFDSFRSALELFQGAKSAEVTSKRIVVRWPETSSR